MIMEIPTYYSYSEFVQNYESDFQKWNEVFPDASEDDYKDEIKFIYSRFNFYEEDFGEYFGLGLHSKGFNGNYITFHGYLSEQDFVKIISNRIYFLCNHLHIELEPTKFSKLLDDITDDYGLFCNSYFDVSGFPDDSQYIEINDITIIAQFLKIEKNFLDDYEVTFDEIKFKNFEYSVNKILNFISENKILNNNTTEIDEAQPKKYSTPEKIKVLDKLNVKGWLQEKGFSVFQIEALLSDLFDVTDKTIRNGFSNNKHDKTAENIISELRELKADRTAKK